MATTPGLVQIVTMTVTALKERIQGSICMRRMGGLWGHFGDF